MVVAFEVVVNLLVFIRLKLDNFVSIPKVLMPQLEVINVKYSSILHVVCFNIEVDQSVKVIVHGVNCAQVHSITTLLLLHSSTFHCPRLC
jgi:hypothetical protein